MLTLRTLTGMHAAAMAYGDGREAPGPTGCMPGIICPSGMQ